METFHTIIRRDLPSYAGRPFPSLRQLAKTYRVSRPVVTRACRRLVDEGLLRRTATGRLVLTESLEPRGVDRSSAERIADLITDGISSGAYRVGLPLPKSAYLAGHHRVSPTTLSRAYRILARDGLIHRDGSRYIAGPRPAGGPRQARVVSPPVVLVVSRSVHEWNGICKSTRTTDFGKTFLREANRTGIQVRHAATESGDEGFMQVPLGTHEVLRFVDALGSRYLGALVCLKGDQGTTVDSWVRTLAERGKPVVWFDRSEDHQLPHPVPRHFTRCHHSEMGAASAAIEYLHEFGHRATAYCPCGEGGWATLRGELLRVAGRQTGVEVTDAPQIPEEAFEDPEGSGLIERVKVAAELRLPGVFEALGTFERRARISPDWARTRHRMPGLPSAWEPFIAISARRGELITDHDTAEYRDGTFLWTTLELAPVLAAGGPTAAISARDLFAPTFLRWLARARVPVPSRVSIVSFDNEYLAGSLALTSVDFGFEELGYQAFHAILGDIPTRRTRDGDIAARPYVVDRGSVGLPRSQRAR